MKSLVELEVNLEEVILNQSPGADIFSTQRDDQLRLHVSPIEGGSILYIVEDYNLDEDDLFMKTIAQSDRGIFASDTGRVPISQSSVFIGDTLSSL